MTAAYDRIRPSLPVDRQPLELLEHAGPDYTRTREPVSSSSSGRPAINADHGYPMADTGRGQHPQRPRLHRHIFSDPEARRVGRLPHSNTEFLSNQRLPQEPYSIAQYPGNLPYLQAGWDDEDEYAMQGPEPSIYGGQHQHQGFYPPLHPRRPQYVWRY